MSKFAYILFSDPAYQPGWTGRRDLPTKRDTLHIGIGTIVQEEEEFITVALFEELYDKTSDVFHPLTILKSHIYKFYEFSEDLIHETIKRRSKNIHKRIDRDVEDFHK